MGYIYSGQQTPPENLSLPFQLIIFLHRLVSGSGDIKMTKDGMVLLREMVSLRVCRMECQYSDECYLIP